MEDQAAEQHLPQLFNIERDIPQHGDVAPIHAAMRADAMLDKGDLGGERVWLRILAAVNELLDTGPGNRAAVH